MKQYSSDKPLISIHIPKCGGQSFRHILDQWFQENQYYHYYDELKKCLPTKINIENNRNVCIHGHFNKYRGFGINQYYPQVDQFISILREPLEILVSNYFYLQTTTQETHGIQFDKKISLEDFLKEQLKNNVGSYYLTHFPDNINENNYKEKIENNFIFLGVMEEYQKSIDILAKKLNKERVIIPQRNIAKRDVYEIDSELIKKIRSKYKIDYLIYSYALEKLSSNNLSEKEI